MKIKVIGNCQRNSIRRILEVLLDDSTVDCSFNKVSRFNGNVEDFYGYDLVFCPLPIEQDVSKFLINEKVKSVVVGVPTITFKGFHPDCITLNNTSLKSGINYHSKIIVAAYLVGLDAQQCETLFTEKVYQGLGYFDAFEQGINRLKGVIEKAKINVDLVDRWVEKGVFMHTTNHPKMFAVEDVVKACLDKKGINYKPIIAADQIKDPLSLRAKYPVLFDRENKEFLNPENIFFKKGGRNEKVFSLSEFISSSYEIYSNEEVTIEQMMHPSFESGGLARISDLFFEHVQKFRGGVSHYHPYRDKPDFCFWKKAISKVDIDSVDPVADFGLKLTKDMKVATAGSCFAQHIANRLSNSGFNYYIAENPPVTFDDHQARKYGFGVFSARYGNIYTARQLLQLFDRAFDDFFPTIEAWTRNDGRYVDPFRPLINPEGYVSIEDVKEDQRKHLHAVREMFENLDVLVFTFGLTECWEHKEDGSILPLAPGVAGGHFDTEKYRFVNFDHGAVRKDFEVFLGKLNGVNPNAKVIITVSPVPLMATYEERHVLVSSTVSKSILRVVADEISKKYTNVFYFPSYEIITGSFNRGAYFQDDLREVTREGVDHVMGLFIKHCTNSDSVIDPMRPSIALQPSAELSYADQMELDMLDEVECEEELLDV